MQELLIGLLVFFIGTTGLLLIMRAVRRMQHRNILAAMQADFDQLDADVRVKCEEEGETAFASGISIGSNPYLPGNGGRPHAKFAAYWAFGYALAAEKATAGV